MSKVNGKIVKTTSPLKIKKKKQSTNTMNENVTHPGHRAQLAWYQQERILKLVATDCLESFFGKYYYIFCSVFQAIIVLKVKNG